MKVDLKLKICRGSAIQKILVREAKSYFATEVTVGTARNHHKLRSSVSIAKYCARKLSKHCSVLAVNNGKIAFQKEASSGSNVGAKAETILLAFQNYILVLGTSVMIPTLLVLLMGGIDSTEESSADGSEDKSMAMVPVQKLEGASSSIFLLMRELPELRSGWSFLHRIISSHRKAFDRPVRQISVVQWEMRLPSRNCLSFSDSDERESCLRCNQGQYSELNEENGAIVPFGNETLSGPSFPSTSIRSLPEELEGLHEKYSATCRLFQYEELLLATSKFKPENMIGKGGSSQVYRGCLPDGKELAVKILKQSEDVLREFILEIEIITEDSEGIRPS